MLQQVRQVITGLATDVAAAIWPLRCAACESDADGAICDACEADLDELAAIAACDACGRSSAGSACPHCGGNGSGRISRMHRLGPFESPLRDLVRRAKFNGRWELCQTLADRLALRVGPLPAGTLVVPVPLHPHRRAIRGYDQADLLARRLAKRTGGSFARCLIRRRNTQPQTELHGTAARAMNLRSAFALDGDVKDQAILLVDDVTTSGSTLRAAARAVHEGHPAAVHAAVVAVASRKQERVEVIEE